MSNDEQLLPLQNVLIYSCVRPTSPRDVATENT